jgi:hypothetical protein
LTTGELGARRSNRGIDSIGVAADKLPRIGGAKSLLNLLIRCIRLTHQNVLLDRAVKENRLLGDIADLSTIIEQVNLC